MISYKISHHIVRDIAIITVSGGCEDRCTEDMGILLDKLIAEGYLRYVLDVTNLTFAESPGFRLIIQKVTEIQSLGGNLIVSGLSGRVERAFNLLRLGSLVPAADNIKSAMVELDKVCPPAAGTGTYG